jgi:hypothetical protein
MNEDSDSLLAYNEVTQKRQPSLIKILVSQTEEEFDEGLEEILERAVDHLEKNANYIHENDEEGISAFLAAFLTVPGYIRVTQEAYSNGHVDLTIEAEYTPSPRRRLAEAKIYKGPEYHVKGLKQLIDRYTTGRERSGIMVEYIKGEGIKNLVVKVRSHLDASKPCLQDGNSQDHRIKWAFTTRHQHSSGEMLRILHLNCNLYRAPAAELSVSSRSEPRPRTEL